MTTRASIPSAGRSQKARVWLHRLAADLERRLRPPEAQFPAAEPHTPISPQPPLQPPAPVPPEMPHPVAPDQPAAVPTILDNGPFIKLTEQCVELFDELDSAAADFDEGRRELAGHVMDRLLDALTACGVDPIDQNGVFDRALHQAIRRPAGLASGDPAWSVRILSPGFKLERRVLRRARVKVERADAAAEPPGEKHD
jgi:hypothetical protein